MEITILLRDQDQTILKSTLTIEINELSIIIINDNIIFKYSKIFISSDCTIHFNLFSGSLILRIFLR